MHGSLAVQLGRSSNYQYEKAAHKVQTGETEAVRLWFHLGIVHSRMHTNLPGPRSRSGESDTTRATNVRWAALMPRSGGGQQMSWRPEFFRWLRRQLIVVEDWPYWGTDFTGDPDLPLPEGDDWDEELGKTSFFDFMFICFFC